MMLCYLVKEELKNSRIQRRVYELLSKAVVSESSHLRTSQREIHFVFFRKPVGFLDSDDRTGHVAGVHFEKTILEGKFHLHVFMGEQVQLPL